MHACRSTLEDPTDLFYRLAVFPIAVPPLAERTADIPLLVRHFLDRAGAAAIRFTEGAFERLALHGWPGNVRELRNFVERAAILFAGRAVGADEAGALLLRRGRLSASEQAALWQATELMPVTAAAAIPPESNPGADAGNDNVVVPIRDGESVDVADGQPVVLREMLAEIERRYIEKALSASDGVIADAARLLSLQRTTLIEKMRKYEMKAA